MRTILTMIGDAMRATSLGLALWAGLTSAGLAATTGAGQQLFNDNCSACHQKTGLGIPGAFPALKGDKFVAGNPKLVAATVLNGRGGMPSFKGSLSDSELSQILSYVRGAWGNKAAPIPPAVFATARKGAQPAGARLQAH
jgi:cytochrome c6